MVLHVHIHQAPVKSWIALSTTNLVYSAIHLLNDWGQMFLLEIVHFVPCSCRDMIQKRHGSHPNLLRLFGWVFPQPDVLHVVMEKAERGLLSALRSGLPLPIRMNIAVDVAKGLKAIHEINYIYEDLKPENVLVRLEALHP